MSELTEVTSSTREVAQIWFEGLRNGDVNSALQVLDPDVEFINYIPVPGYNTDMAWIGTQRGPQAVLESFKVFTGICDVRAEEPVTLVVEGSEAMAVLHEESVVRATGIKFEIEFVQHLTVRDGKIVRWRSFTDPSPILQALHGHQQ